MEQIDGKEDVAEKKALDEYKLARLQEFTDYTEDEVTEMLAVYEAKWELIKYVRIFEKKLSLSLKKTYDLQVKKFIEYYKIGDLCSRMLAQRLVRHWLEIQYIDELLDYIGITKIYLTKGNNVVAFPRYLLDRRSTLESQLRSYMDDLGLTGKQMHSYKLEQDKLKLREKQTKIKNRLINKEGEIDFARIISENAKKE